MSDPTFQSVSLRTNRLTVRPFASTDAGELYSILSQPKVTRFLPEDIKTPDEVSELIDWLVSCYKENTSARIKKWTQAVVWNETEQLIGWSGLGPLDFSESEIELYCGLSESYWGMDVAAEACRAVLDYAFSHSGLTRIVAVVDPLNTQSQRLVEKLDMQLEKRLSGLPNPSRHYEGFLYYSISKEKGAA